MTDKKTRCPRCGTSTIPTPFEDDWEIGYGCPNCHDTIAQRKGPVIKK